MDISTDFDEYISSYFELKISVFDPKYSMPSH